MCVTENWYCLSTKWNERKTDQTFKDKDFPSFQFHRIIHRYLLCLQPKGDGLKTAMTLVIIIANFIWCHLFISLTVQNVISRVCNLKKKNLFSKQLQQAETFSRTMRPDIDTRSYDFSEEELLNHHKNPVFIFREALLTDVTHIIMSI